MLDSSLKDPDDLAMECTQFAKDELNGGLNMNNFQHEELWLMRFLFSYVGRQIRNAVQTAQALAHSDGAQVKAATVREVLAMQQKFKRELRDFQHTMRGMFL